jgi:hypothetical protein
VGAIGATLGGPLEVKRVASVGERGILMIAHGAVDVGVLMSVIASLQVVDREHGQFQCFPPKLSWTTMHDAGCRSLSGLAEIPDRRPQTTT